jgi:hypothetical protein
MAFNPLHTNNPDARTPIYMFLVMVRGVLPYHSLQCNELHCNTLFYYDIPNIFQLTGYLYLFVFVVLQRYTDKTILAALAASGGETDKEGVR